MTDNTSNTDADHFTYAASGVDRSSRERTRKRISHDLKEDLTRYPFGKPVELPFGLVFPDQEIVPSFADQRFIDLQIEGVGTKTLLTELDEDSYETIGIDGVAMAANDVIRSGAKPILLSDAIHIADSREDLIAALLKGIRIGAQVSGCTISSGETGDVAEILHGRLEGSRTEPFDLMVSCFGAASGRDLIQGKIFPGDELIGIESSGIHSNGLTLARKVLMREWGGKFAAYDTPDGIDRPLIKELLVPTRIYVSEVVRAARELHPSAAVHITGDGFAKFRRLLDFQIPQGRPGLGVEFEKLDTMPKIFKLIYETAQEAGRPISVREMYSTFNMGYGFVVILAREIVDDALDLFNKYHPARRIGRVTQSGQIVVRGLESMSQPILL